MKCTITIHLNNRYNDAERLIGLFSSTGYKIEKMLFLKDGDTDRSQLIVVTDSVGKRVENLLMRLRQQVRVKSVECIDGDAIIGEIKEVATRI